ncbi:four helix bundle protein [Arcticibacterium luteifluviistationis]|uniref:Four helix bundle protein n=1 Tax=Arcticibacterium luteifluviistationis TaxID=1784714 RepID=A0A2Z4GIM2_9BACT|nr:four helix bundle protein [Arcticibacterium luteifluviistationis]AWW00958.1 hypothetical protein DJ013_17660 [Arcticibacterium luteifluviistationis]
MKSYQDLDVWKKSRKLVSEIYQVTSSFPDNEKFGLVSQMRRASVSIPSNLAEGHGRRYNKEKVRFILISRGSIYELETQLYLSYDLGFIEEGRMNEVLELSKDVKMMMGGLIKFLEKQD